MLVAIYEKARKALVFAVFRTLRSKDVTVEAHFDALQEDQIISIRNILRIMIVAEYIIAYSGRALNARSMEVNEEIR